MKRVITSGGVGAALVLAASAVALAGTSLTQFVLLPGEETGFKPGRPQLASTVKAWVHGESKGDAKKDSKRLTAEGFVAAVSELTHNAKLHGEGLSSAVELGSPAQAAKELAYDVRSDIASQGKGTLIHKFSIAGVPGAVGFTAKGRHEPGGAANVAWQEGSCVLLVGDFLPKGSGSALAGPVTAGTIAVYKRTNGSCP